MWTIQNVMLACACAVLTSSCKGDDIRPATDAPRPPDASADPDADPADANPDAPPDIGRILHYEFEDTATVVTDSSPRAKHGTLSDAAAWTAEGRTGRGLALSGANPATQFVTLPDGVLTGVTDFSIAVWVKLDGAAAWTRIYDFGNGQSDPANRFMYLTTNGFSGGTNGLMASSYGGSVANELALNAGTQLPPGVWKHVVVTGSGGDRTIYVDGFPAATVTGGPVVAPQEMEPIAPNSWLGRSRFPDPGLGGTLDELQIYDRVLSRAEIADLAWPKLDYAYWRFDETSGTTAAISSDHTIPTVLANDVTWTTGRLGGAIDFPGGAAGPNGPTVTLAANPLAGCTTELTVAAWTKLRAHAAWSRIFDFGTGGTRFIYLAPSDGGGVLRFAMVAPSGAFDLLAPAPLPADDAWHHVAVTVDAAGLATIYVDGTAVVSQVSPDVRPSDFTELTELWLGKSRFPDPYLDGAIDELRIGCRALTAGEIRNLSRPE